MWTCTADDDRQANPESLSGMHSGQRARIEFFPQHTPKRSFQLFSFQMLPQRLIDRSLITTTTFPDFSAECIQDVLIQQDGDSGFTFICYRRPSPGVAKVIFFGYFAHMAIICIYMHIVKAWSESPSGRDFHAIAADDDRPLEMVAHALDEGRFGGVGRGNGREKMCQRQFLHARFLRHPRQRQ